MSVLSADLVKATEVLWVNLVLSGDSAMVHAMLLGTLPASKRPIALVMAVIGAASIRLLALGPMLLVLAFPGGGFIGALALVGVAMYALHDAARPEREQPERRSLLQTVGLLVSSDMLMGVDNAIAVAAVSGGQLGPLVVGLVVSIAIAMACGGVLARLGGRSVGWIAGLLVAWSASGLLVDQLAGGPDQERPWWAWLVRLAVVGAVPTLRWVLLRTGLWPKHSLTAAHRECGAVAGSHRTEE